MPLAVAGSHEVSADNDSGHDALQALLAFACMHQQAAKQRPSKTSDESASSREETFGLDEVLRLVAVRALSITGADGVAVALAEENAIVCRASAGKIAPDPGIRLDPNSGFSGTCLRGGETVRCDDSETDSRVNAQACRSLGTRSMIAVPLTAKQRVIGLIEAFSSEPFGFNESDVHSLNLLAELILAAIRPEEEDRLAQLAAHVVPSLALAKSKTAPGISMPVAPEDSKKAPEISASVVVPAASATPPPATLAPAAPKTELLASSMSKAASAAPAAAHTESTERSTPPIAVAPTTAHSKIIIDEKFVPVHAPASSPAPPPAPNPVSRANDAATKKLTHISPSFSEPKLNLKGVPIEAPGSRPKSERSISSIVLTAALVLVAIGLGWAWVWKFRHVEQSFSASANTKPTAPSVPVAGLPPETSPTPVAKPGVTPQVTGIRHWSAADSSTVVVDLEDQVQYEAHSIDNPARIYFDLHDTKMAPGLLNQSIAVNDTFLKRVRMAQPQEGVTRIVLETKGSPEFSVKLDSNPYRLTIEVHNVSGQAAPSNLSKPSPEVSVAPKKKISSNSSSVNPGEFRIVLDAGHGGWDLGTVGRKGLLEKDLVLDIVQKLGKLLETKLGAQVIYTRSDDSYLPLEKRAEVANLARADLFLSVHANYSDLITARGVETYYTNTYSSLKARTADDVASLKEVNWTGVDIREKVTGSHHFASDVQQALYGGLVARNPDLRNRGVKEAQYVVLTGTQMPAVLAEVSFVSSPADENNLQSSEYRQQIAEALYRGVAKYRDESKHTKVASAKN